MVPSNDLWHWVRNIPRGQNMCCEHCMIESIQSTLQVVYRVGLGAALGKEFDVLVALRFHQHEFADVVEKASRKKVIYRQSEMRAQIPTKCTNDR
jgi:hypothetical protein